MENADRIFLDKWGIREVYGDKAPELPLIPLFNNSIEGCKLLHKHLASGSHILCHADVDCDGLGCAYILNVALKHLSSVAPSFTINNGEKEHGIKERHVDFINNNPDKFKLILITDSSSNDIELIKKFHCDVLVIDHHEMDHNDLMGYTEDGHLYVIINNMVENTNIQYQYDNIKTYFPDQADKISSTYEVTDAMSCGLVVYEFMRLYEILFKRPQLVENLQLYQWSALTLFTDSISLINPRNQWYIQNTINNVNREPTLDTLVRMLNPYNNLVDKYFITYKLAPIINKAIRAGHAKDALTIVLNKPGEIGALKIYKQDQDEAIEAGTNPEAVKVSAGLVMSDLTNLVIPRTGNKVLSSYCGVIASNLVNTYNRSAICYKIEDGIIKGSFRGLNPDIDYRSFFKVYCIDEYAKGHKQAFGFKISIENLDILVKDFIKLGEMGEREEFLTFGDGTKHLGAKYHIETIESLKADGTLWKIATGNSNVTSSDEIHIIASSSELTLIQQNNNYSVYRFGSFECIAFEEPSNYIGIYFELGKKLNAYIKNKKSK